MNTSLIDGDWPVADLESAPRCEVCGSNRRSVWLVGLRDRIFHTAPGRWTLWRCDDCHSAQLDPRPTAASIGRAYTAYYTHRATEKSFLVPGDRRRPSLRIRRALHMSYYNHQFGHRLTGAWPLGWLAIMANRRRSANADQLIRHLPSAVGQAMLLDVGCGSGGFMRVARTLGYHACGIELDPSAAALAQGHGFEVFIGSISRAEIAPESVDQITLNHVIEHLYDPVAALQRMLGWLRSGGRIWLQTPNIDSTGATHYQADWRGLEPPRHLVLFGQHSLRLALERAGFERIELMLPRADSVFYIEQSEGIRARRDPYAPNHTVHRAARREAAVWDVAALTWPERAESITMVGFKPGGDQKK